MATPPDFSVGQVLTAAQMNAVGLWHLKTVTLSTVTNNVSDVFSSDYRAYRVVISDLNNGSGTGRAVKIRFRNASGDDQTSNYFHFDQAFYGTNTSGFTSLAGQTSGQICVIADGGSDGGAISFDVINPNLAKATVYCGGKAITYQADVGVYVMRDFAGGINTTTVYTGFSIIGTTDNLSGRVDVYGYNAP
jgi:hypothetical protein